MLKTFVNIAKICILRVFIFQFFSLEKSKENNQDATSNDSYDNPLQETMRRLLRPHAIVQFFN